MKRQNSIVEENITSVVVIIGLSGLLFFTGWFWVFELIVVLLIVALFRRLEQNRKKFLSEIPANVFVSAPLKPKIQNKFFFILGILFLILLLYTALFNDNSNFLKDGFSQFGFIYSIIYVISYVHQLIRPRTIYFTQESIYFYEHLQVLNIPFDNIKRIELHDNEIWIFEEKKKKVLKFQKDMSLSTFQDVQQHLMQAAPKYGYGVTNRQLR